MEQIKALNALEPFLALTKSVSSPRAATDLIASATSAPNVYIFTDLINSPQIRTHAPPASLQLLEIFSYGTYTDYANASSTLPELSPTQLTKLQQLSLLTLAKEPENLTYSILIQKLGLSSNKQLEDLVISAIYAGLLTATLDPLHSTVLISSIAPLRDVSPSSIPTMIATLKEWELRCSDTLLSLEAQIKSIREEAARRAREESEWSKRVEKLIESQAPKTMQEFGKSGNFETENQRGGGVGGLGVKAMHAIERLTGRKGEGIKRGYGGGDGIGEYEDDMDLDDDEDVVKSGGGRGGGKASKKRGYGAH